MAGSPFTRGPAYALLVAEALSGEIEPGSHHASLLAECDPLRALPGQTGAPRLAVSDSQSRKP